jgi:hypothetical protein
MEASESNFIAGFCSDSDEHWVLLLKEQFVQSVPKKVLMGQ